jgi:hypothetical protein
MYQKNNKRPRVGAKKAIFSRKASGHWLSLHLVRGKQVVDSAHFA